MMKNIPPAAVVGLFFTALYFFVAIFAQWIAPYGMAEVGLIIASPTVERRAASTPISRAALARHRVEALRLTAS